MKRTPITTKEAEEFLIRIILDHRAQKTESTRQDLRFAAKLYIHIDEKESTSSSSPLPNSVSESCPTSC